MDLYYLSAIVIVFGFIVTFGLTVYGLLKPGRIPPGYLKALFSAVLLEIIAGFFALFYAGPLMQEPNQSKPLKKMPTIVTAKKDMIMLDRKGNILEQVVLRTGDTLVSDRDQSSIKESLKLAKRNAVPNGDKIYLWWGKKKKTPLGFITQDVLQSNFEEGECLSPEEHLILAEGYQKEASTKIMAKHHLLQVFAHEESQERDKHRATRLMHYILNVLPIDDPNQDVLKLYVNMIKRYRSDMTSNLNYELGYAYFVYGNSEIYNRTKRLANRKLALKYLKKYLSFELDKGTEKYRAAERDASYLESITR